MQSGHADVKSKHRIVVRENTSAKSTALVDQLGALEASSATSVLVVLWERL